MTILATESDSVRPNCLSAEPQWQTEVKLAIRDPAELCRLLSLPAGLATAALGSIEQFPLFAPRPYLARIQPGNPADPLLRQVMPIVDEQAEVAGFVPDPLAEQTSTRAAGMLQKYRGRALLITTGACAIHCRYCFRRHYPYDGAPKSLAAWAPALAEIESDPSIDEVILSGGDPLMLVDASLAALVERLASIPHLRRLRVHSRLPIVIPQRVTDALLAWLTGTRLTPVFVVHANHPAELDDTVARAIAQLVEARVLVLNQAVLLRGVNDDEETLAQLSERLIDLRVTPYYLHQLDAVAGAAHFAVPESRGIELVAALRARLPGYAVPRYVQEIPGATSKTPLV
jgi:EF-P beta-lysylation protein EpmB